MVELILFVITEDGLPHQHTTGQLRDDHSTDHTKHEHEIILLDHVDYGRSFSAISNYIHIRSILWQSIAIHLTTT